MDKSGQPVLEPDLLKWAKWFEQAERIIRQTVIGEVRISTIFLGIDHAFGCGMPLLFETMIFGGEHGSYQARCCTEAEAIEQHFAACSRVRQEK